MWVPETKKEYKIGMITFGVFFIGLGIYFNLETLLVTERSLMPIEGTLQYSKSYVDRVYSENRMGGKSYSYKATLELKLFQETQIFRIFENIGQERNHPEFNRVNRILQRGKKVTLFISKRTIKYGPDFYRLDINGETEIDISFTKSKSMFGFGLMLFFGFLFIYLSTMSDSIKRLKD